MCKWDKEGEQMKDVIMTTYTIALPIVLSYIVWMLKEQNKKRDANAQGTLMLLRIQLIEYHDKYCSMGYIPNYVYQNYCDLFEAYKGMGGNGLGVKMKEEIDELEIRNHAKDIRYGRRKEDKVNEQ